MASRAALATVEVTNLLYDYINGRTEFVRNVFGAEPDPWQYDANKALDEGKRRVCVRSGHGVGKTTWLAWQAWHALATRVPLRIPCTAPTSAQLRDVLWAEMYKWFQRMDESMRDQFRFTGDSIELRAAPLESFMVARTARRENPDALQGFHGENVLFIIDEGSGVDEKIFEVAEGALTSEGARAIMTGNPVRNSGFFWRVFHRNMGWHRVHVNGEDCERVSQDFINSIIAGYGKESNVYRVRVQGKFPSAEDDIVIPLDLAEEARLRKVDPPPVSAQRPVWGLDPARFGDDRTALAKRHGLTQMEPVQSWRKRDTVYSAGRVKEEWDATPSHMKPALICVDVIGIGAGVYDVLKQEIDSSITRVISVNVSEASTSNTKYKRLRDELWFLSRNYLKEEGGTLHPDDEQLVNELASPHFGYTPSGLLEVESKDDMKELGMDSPDLADAWNMTFYRGFKAPAHRAGPRRKRNLRGIV